MEEWIEKFIGFLKETKKAPENTLLSYERDLRQFNAFLATNGITKVEKVNQTNIIAYIMDLQKRGRMAATVSRNLTSIRRFFRFLISSGEVSQDPSEGVASPKIEKRTPEIITVDEVARLLAQPRDNHMKGIRDKAMMEVLYATGIRVSELISLKVSDVDVTLQFVRCHTAKKERIIPMGSKAAEALRLYFTKARNKLIKSQEEEVLFVNCVGASMTRQGFWKIVKDYATQAHIESAITPHILRHSFASHLIHNGADLKSVQEMLGHADMNTTQMYLRAQQKQNKIKEVYAKTHPRF